MTKLEIFSTPLWHIEGAPQQLVDELYEGAYICKESVESAQLSNRGGYQSPSFKWDQFHPDGIEYINKILSNTFKPLRYGNVLKYDGKYQIQNWWYNINSKGDSNIAHAHPSSDYALVWYLTDNERKLVLINPNQKQDQSECFTPDANKGDILIFPADIIHFVLPNDKKDDRICISMNISIRDKYS